MTSSINVGCAKKVLVVFITALCLMGCDKEVKELYFDDDDLLHLDSNCKNAKKIHYRRSITDLYRSDYIHERILCPLCIDYKMARMLISENEKFQERLMKSENRVILEDVNGVVKYVPECQYGGCRYDNYYIHIALGKTLYLLPYEKFTKFKKQTKCIWSFPPCTTAENLDSIVDTFEDLTYLESIYNLFIRKGFSEDDLCGSFYKFKERLKKPGKIKKFHKWANSNNVELIPFPEFEKAVMECLENK